MEVIIFFLYAMILLPGTTGTVHQVKSFLNHTAYLSCYFPNSQKSDIKDLIVFWQKGLEVVHEVYYGQEKHDNISPEYKNRTKMDMDKWTLQLLNAGIVDEGLYECIIQQRVKGIQNVIHRSECLLHIIANYSQPEIARLHKGELKPNEYLKLYCSSSGGYPEPKQMTWLISHENRTRRLMNHMDISQDAVTKLYNVTTKLNTTVPTNTLTNISCLLHLGEELGSLVSVPLSIEITQGEEIEQVKIHFFGPLIAVIVLITILLGFAILKNRNISCSNQNQRRNLPPLSQRKRITGFSTMSLVSVKNKSPMLRALTLNDFSPAAELPHKNRELRPGPELSPTDFPDMETYPENDPELEP